MDGVACDTILSAHCFFVVVVDWQEEDDQISMTWNDPFNKAYKKLFFNKAGTRLLGGILVGDASDYTTLLVSSAYLYRVQRVMYRVFVSLYRLPSCIVQCAT